MCDYRKFKFRFHSCPGLNRDYGSPIPAFLGGFRVQKSQDLRLFPRTILSMVSRYTGFIVDGSGSGIAPAAGFSVPTFSPG